MGHRLSAPITGACLSERRILWIGQTTALGGKDCPIGQSFPELWRRKVAQDRGSGRIDDFTPGCTWTFFTRHRV